MRQPGIKPGSSPWQGPILSLYYWRNYGVSGFRSQYLVLAKHARFRLRQYLHNLAFSFMKIKFTILFRRKKSAKADPMGST